LNALAHITELADNVKAEDPTINGITQNIRENPFWDLRDDVSDLVAKGFAAVRGLSINQFNCSWRGNFLLEIGDKIAMVTKDNEVVHSYLLNDVMNYNGGFKATTQWSYSASKTEQANSSPATIGEALRQTYAKVDKASKRIELVVEDTANLIIEQNKISSSVSEMSNSIEGLTKRVEMTTTPEDVQIQIQTSLANGVVNEITTTTGFTFNDEGLTVSKSGAEMTTTVSDDGMVVCRGADALLTANHEGVDAMNLHATTYLYIGAHSLLQDYDLNSKQRTGCFWIEK
jgi:hypothetical protein